MIYLDYAATTPVDQRVADKMMHYLTANGQFGNSSAMHVFGYAAKHAIDEARAKAAELIHADPSEILFTSGATEANNLALKGVAQLYESRGKHIITMQTEHASVIESCKKLEKQGFLVTYLAPDANGLLDLDALSAAFRPETILVSIMHVNNETGVIQHLKQIAELTKSRGVLFHTDAVQSVGKMPINVEEIPIDLMSFSAHKLYGPKGVGALYIRRKPRVRVAAQHHGGGQEHGMRSGTLPVHQIVALGEACEIARKEMMINAHHIATISQQFRQGISGLNPIVLGEPSHHYPGILNICFSTIRGLELIKALPELAFSIGSACHSKGVEASLVLRAMGLSEEEALHSVRFSFGKDTTAAEIERAVEVICMHITKIPVGQTQRVNK